MLTGKVKSVLAAGLAAVTVICSMYIAPHPADAGVLSNAKIENVIRIGQSYMGTPYEFSSNRKTTTTFDCSDFVKFIYQKGAGKVLPGDSRKQGAYIKEHTVETANWHSLKRGDLMFFMSYKGSKASSYKGLIKSNQRITHVALYLGDGKVLHTYSKASGGVRIDSIEGTQWEYRFLFGGAVT